MLATIEDNTEIAAASAPEKRRSRAKKVRLLSLHDLDDRTRAAQLVREMRAEVIADLGGEERLSTMERGATEHVALTAAMIRDAGVRWIHGQEIDPGSVATLINAFNRTASILGWQRRATDVTPDVYEIAAGKAKDRGDTLR